MFLYYALNRMPKVMHRQDKIRGKTSSSTNSPNTQKQKARQAPGQPRQSTRRKPPAPQSPAKRQAAIRDPPKPSAPSRTTAPTGRRAPGGTPGSASRSIFQICTARPLDILAHRPPQHLGRRLISRTARRHKGDVQLPRQPHCQRRHLITRCPAEDVTRRAHGRASKRASSGPASQVSP